MMGVCICATSLPASRGAIELHEPGMAPLAVILKSRLAPSTKRCVRNIAFSESKLLILAAVRQPAARCIAEFSQGSLQVCVPGETLQKPLYSPAYEAGVSVPQDRVFGTVACLAPRPSTQARLRIPGQTVLQVRF